LQFVVVAAPDAIKQWKTRPVVAFAGFDAVKYGFTRAEFYRWHLPVPGREDFDGTTTSKDRLALAIRVVNSGGERWFELTAREKETEDQLYIQPLIMNDESDTEDASKHGPKPDEMDGWINIQLATPDAGLPLFILKYQHNDLEVYSASSLENKLFVDLRTSTPQTVNSVSCRSFESIGGACSGTRRGQRRQRHIAMSMGRQGQRLPLHHDHSLRQRLCAAPGASRFLLAIGQAGFRVCGTGPKLRDLAFAIRNNNTNVTDGVLMSGLGPTTMLEHFKDLLPQTDVFVFASPGAGEMWNAHLSLVTIDANGKVDVQAIPKWGIAGEETDEYKTTSSKILFPSKLVTRVVTITLFRSVPMTPIAPTHWSNGRAFALSTQF
jgi:hypothetical protein